MKKRLYILSLLFAFVLLGFARVSGQNLSSAQQEKIAQYRRQIQGYQSHNNLRGEAGMHNKIGQIYWDAGNNLKAIESFKQSLALNKKIGNTKAIFQLNNYIGGLYSDMGDHSSALPYMQASFDASKKLRSRNDRYSGFFNLAVLQKNLAQHSKAITNLEAALQIALQTDDQHKIRSVYGELAENYKKLGDIQQSQKYYDLFRTFDNHIKAERIKQSEIQAAKAQSEKKAKELELKVKDFKLKLAADSLEKTAELSEEQRREIERLNLERQNRELQIQVKQKEAKLRAERIVRYSLIGISAIVIVFSILLLRQFQAKKRANKLLEKKNLELEAQKREIQEKNELLAIANDKLEEANMELEHKNQQITDSIKYASKIQEAILPSRKAIHQTFPDSFIFYRPRDIVSGDFYWFSEQGSKLFISAVDCTGHSVPGAFMSMIGNTLLNEIINEKKIFDLSEILKRMNAGVIKSLKQDIDEETQDGMDVTLCCVDTEQKKLQIASANHSVVVFKDHDEAQIVQGDLFSIGGVFSLQKNIKYTTHEVDLTPGTTFYMFSDGYPDQFGGEKNKKFMFKRFKALLEEIQPLSMDEQGEQVGERFDLWRGSRRQIDDVLVIGIRLQDI